MLPPGSIYANPNAPPPIYGGAPAPMGVQVGAPYGVPYAGSAGSTGSGIGAHASPRVMAAPLGAPDQSLPQPEGFSRPPNRAHPYTQFEMLRIGDMDEVLENMPRMPAVLVPHDVYHEDWIRLMTVCSLSSNSEAVGC